MEDLSAITHTAGTSTAVATTTSVVNAPTGTFGAKTATSVYDAAGNAMGVFADGTVTEFVTAHQTTHLNVTAAVGKVVRILKVGTGTVQYVKADGSGVQTTPAELTVANPFVPGLTAADKYTVEAVTSVAATGGALTMAAGSQAGKVIRVTKVSDGVVTYAAATTGLAMVTTPTVITGVTDPFVVGTGLTATDKYVVEILTPTTAGAAPSYALTGAANTDVVKITNISETTTEFGAAGAITFAPAVPGAAVKPVTVATAITNNADATLISALAGLKVIVEIITGANVITVL